jgi:hypothetical protein
LTIPNDGDIPPMTPNGTEVDAQLDAFLEAPQFELPEPSKPGLNMNSSVSVTKLPAVRSTTVTAPGLGGKMDTKGVNKLLNPQLSDKDTRNLKKQLTRKRGAPQVS